MTIDRSLDEIISSKPKNLRRGARRGPRGAAIGSNGTGAAPAAAAARDRYSGSTPAANGRSPAPAAAAASGPTATKIIVSNLPIDVNEAQIRDLFSSTVGPLKEVTLNFDAAGRSKGVATVVFVRRGDGSNAFNQYNNRLIDGKRPMKVEMIMDAPAPPTLSQRVAPVAKTATAAAPGTTPRGPAKPRGAAGGRGGRGGRKRGEARPKKTAEDLDAEMEDYSTTNNQAAAPTATA